VVEFSPSRGWSAAHYVGIGTVMLGQWERLFDETPPDIIISAMGNGKRIVVIGRSDHALSQELPADRKPVALYVYRIPFGKIRRRCWTISGLRG
jgi:hypothetical protein